MFQLRDERSQTRPISILEDSPMFHIGLLRICEPYLCAEIIQKATTITQVGARIHCSCHVATHVLS